MSRKLRHLEFALLAASLLTWLGALFLPRTSTIPPDFQFQSQLLRNQAEFFYTQARHELHQTHWHAIYGHLRNYQFKLAWQRFRNGQGHLDGVLVDSNSNVVACVRFKDGNTFWPTLQSGPTRALAKEAVMSR